MHVERIRRFKENDMPDRKIVPKQKDNSKNQEQHFA